MASIGELNEGTRAVLVHNRWGLVLLEATDPEEVEAAVLAIYDVRSRKETAADAREKEEAA